MEARAVIEKIHASRENGVKRGLENTARLMKALNIHPGVPVIHVAGTNGKGSTCAMLESALRPYRTGLFTSPFLQQYAERIRIDGRPATDEMISSCGSEVLRCAEALNREGVYPTPFELGTALAALIFQREQVGVWILETGMGGRNDPTTAIPADLSGITSIGLDHRQYLGDTIEDIAREKAQATTDAERKAAEEKEAYYAAMFARPDFELTTDEPADVKTKDVLDKGKVIANINEPYTTKLLKIRRNGSGMLLHTKATQDETE